MASPIKKRAPQWEVKAKQQLAIWKQHLPVVKAIEQSEIIVTRRGLAIDDLRSHNFRELLESHIYAVVCQEAEVEIEKWGRNTEVVESVVYASFLVDAAKEVGIEVEKVRAGSALTLEALQPKTKLCKQASLVWTVCHWSHR